MVVRQQLPLLRTSERSAFKRCPWRWHQAYNRGLVPNNPRADARWFGTGIHLCKAEWYVPGFERGRDMHETWDEYAKDSFARVAAQSLVDEEYQRDWVDANELAHAMIDAHLARYGTDPSWEVIAAEQRFNVRIPHPANPARAVVRYVGTIDLILRDHDQVKGDQMWLDDTKTAARIYTHHLPLLEQPASYVAVGTHTLREQGLIGPKERIKGIIFDFMRKAMPDTRPRNENGEATNKPIKKHYVAAILDESVAFVVDNPAFPDVKDLMKKKLEELQAIAEDRNLVVLGDVSADQGTPNFLREYIRKSPAENRRQIQRIGEEALMMKAVRAGKVPILKTPQDDCNFCDYFELCELDESGGDTEYYEQMAYNVQDSWADHRDDAENSKTSVANKVKTGVK